MSKIWRFYYPDDGGSVEEAFVFSTGSSGLCPDDESVARFACEFDYSDRDGWERDDEGFDIVVVAFDGTKTRFIGRHEPSVDHVVRRAS